MYEVFYMAEGCFKPIDAHTRIEALQLAAKQEYGVEPDLREIKIGKFSYGYRDLAIKFKTSEH